MSNRRAENMPRSYPSIRHLRLRTAFPHSTGGVEASRATPAKASSSFIEGRWVSPLFPLFPLFPLVAQLIYIVLDIDSFPDFLAQPMQFRNAAPG